VNKITFITGAVTHCNHRGFTDDPLVVYVAKGGYEFERWFPVVCLMFAACKPTEVPTGHLGPYRTPASKKFSEQGRELIERWRNLVPKKDSNKKRKLKVENAKRMVVSWQRKTKLAATKLKVWKRRLAAAERALAKATLDDLADREVPKGE